MSYETRIVSNNDNNSAVAYQRAAHFGSSVQHSSTIVINLRQLHNELQTQHQHEKQALNELNQRFQLFIDRVRLLESENSKYLAQIADARRLYRGESSIDSQWSERYLLVQSDLATSGNARIDFEAEFEWFQLQISIYQQMIDGEQHWKDKRCLILEQELKQLSSDLTMLHQSYTDLERIVQSNYAERDNMFKQYLTLTYDWCNLKKQQKKWILSVDTLKSYVAFYNNIRSYQGGDYSVSIQSDDTAQYWKLELEKCVKRIRQDFETYYATAYRELTSYYETKIEEVRVEVEKPVRYESTKYEEITIRQETMKVEYEQVQITLTSEKETYMRLEASCSKLESEFRSLELYYQEQFDSRAQELYNAHESLVMMAYDIDEIRRSKVNLEAEIIVYRYLLDINETRGLDINETRGVVRQAIVLPPQPVGNELTGKFVAKRQKKGRIGIKDCDASGLYITLVNHSASRDIDLSRWVIKRRIDSSADLRYTIPDGVQLQRESELRIYSRQGSKNGASSSWSQQRLVNNDLQSWGVGNTIETFLLNERGEEEASYSQSMSFKRSTTYDDY